MLNIDCICAIPQIIFKKRGKEFRQEISIHNKKISQNFLEAIRVLRARIEKDARKNNLKVFLVTSAASSEGKSTIAANIAMALAKSGVRIEAPIPGKAAVGIEVPNDKTTAVKLRNLIENPDFVSSWSISKPED